MTAVVLSVDGAVATVTLNRPESLNTLNPQLAAELSVQLKELAADNSVRCVVLTGEGGHFMAGGDIAYFDEVLAESDQIDEKVAELMGNVHDIICKLREMPQPVVAAVKGACAGFGVSLMCACDLAVAQQGSVFTLAYCHLGVSPDGGSTWSLPRMIGMKRATELVLLGDRFDADRAEHIGLINRVVASEDFESEVAQIATRLANGPAQAYARGKGLLQQSLQTSLENQLNDEGNNFIRCAKEPAFAEGVSAFLAKRKPDFSGK